MLKKLSLTCRNLLNPSSTGSDSGSYKVVLAGSTPAAGTIGRLAESGNAPVC